MSTIDIRNPIIVIGTGRCGSSVFSSTLARHPNLAYMTAFSEKFPGNNWIHQAMMRLVDMPLSKRLIESRLGLAESYAFWAKHDNGFPRPCRDLVSTDVRNNVRESVRRDLSRLLTPKRDRLLLKFTGWPRIGYLQEIFPDAHFIHVVRDGRAVANSNITTPQWWGWRGPQNWRLGELTPEMMHEWEKYGRSFVVLAGLYWRIIVDAVESTKTAVSEDRFTQIRYEDFINAPLSTNK